MAKVRVYELAKEFGVESKVTRSRSGGAECGWEVLPVPGMTEPSARLPPDSGTGPVGWLRPVGQCRTVRVELTRLAQDGGHVAAEAP